MAVTISSRCDEVMHILAPITPGRAPRQEKREIEMADRTLGPGQGGSFVNEIGIGRSGLMRPTAYDTAWLARIPAEHDLAVPAFPEALDWLRQNQRPDGSWGAEVEYLHDRVISTMAAILALAKQGEDGQDEHPIERGLRYIWEKADQLKHEHETIGFEMILPTLAKECRELGLALPLLAFERYERMRDEKLARIPQDMLYSRNTTLAFSLEFMGDDFDAEKARFLQESNGSVAVSPSATAYFLTKWPDNVAARRYIADIVGAYGGKAPQMFPFDVFETAWSLWNLLLADIEGCDQWITRHTGDLKALWDRGKGTSSSSSFSVVNADDSAMVFSVLRLVGLDPDPGPLYQFEGEDHFICHSFERNPSTSANIHVLEALKGVDGPGTDKVLRWLRSVQVDGGYWMAKWHASPYYPTAHAVIALMGVDPDLAKSAVQWILDTQRPEGCWGHYDRPTAEETAYCLQALSVYDHHVEPVDRRVLAQGREGLLACRGEMPALWIGKCLYTPVRVVESAIYSALALTRP
jgi:halimadienyl-diphosphate synthase